MTQIVIVLPEGYEDTVAQDFHKAVEELYHTVRAINVATRVCPVCNRRTYHGDKSLRHKEDCPVPLIEDILADWESD